MADIHPTAVIAAGASLGGGVRVGPYCTVGPDAALEDGVELVSHVSVAGATRIGAHTRVFPFASLGHPPQDLKYKGEASRLVIGAHTVIREHVTMNPGTEGGGLMTETGERCLFMVGAHVAHDCRVGNQVILANNATLAGHVTVGDHAVIGGLAAVHQFVRIGAHAMIGGMSGVEHDVIPFGSVMGERASLAGLNLVGLKRRGFGRDAIHTLRSLYKELFESGGGSVLQERLSGLRERYAGIPEAMEMLRFMEERGSRSLCLPKAGAARTQAA